MKSTTASIRFRPMKRADSADVFSSASSSISSQAPRSTSPTSMDHRNPQRPRVVRKQISHVREALLRFQDPVLQIVFRTRKNPGPKEERVKAAAVRINGAITECNKT